MVKRYAIDGDNIGCGAVAYPEKDGDYVEYDDYARDIAALEKDRDGWRKARDYEYKRAEGFKEERDSLAAKCEKYERALKRIADGGNWFHTSDEPGGTYTARRGDGEPDEIARETLGGK